MSTGQGEGPLKLVEECVGVGEVTVRDRVFPGIAYDVKRFQGMAPSGLPVPGLHKIEGRLGVDCLADPHALVNAACTLRLEDGRTLRLTLMDAEGRVLAEGHGPSRCLCC